MKIDLEEYNQWKQTHPIEPHHLLPFLHYKREQLLAQIRERKRNRPINPYNLMIGTHYYL